MPNVLNEFAGDGVTRTFTFSMTGGYLSRDFVVFLTRPNDSLLDYTPYTGTVVWVSDFTVEISEPIPVGTTFVITRRTTPEAMVDFQNTSRITEHNLDTAFNQSLHRTVELDDITERRMLVNANLTEEAVAAAMVAETAALESANAANVAQSLVASAERAAVDAAASAQSAEEVAGEALDLIQQAIKGNVDSFNGRDGAVMPQTGDYSPSMVGFINDGYLNAEPVDSQVPAWDDPYLNTQAQALLNRTETLKDNQKRTPLIYGTYAEASAAAATLPDGQVVAVNGYFYDTQAGVLTNKRPAASLTSFTGAGGAERNLQEKLSLELSSAADWVGIDRTGATGTASQLEAFIRYACLNGGVYSIPDGDYLIERGIVVYPTASVKFVVSPNARFSAATGFPPARMFLFNNTVGAESNKVFEWVGGQYYCKEMPAFDNAVATDIMNFFAENYSRVKIHFDRAYGGGKYGEGTSGGACFITLGAMPNIDVAIWDADGCNETAIYVTGDATGVRGESLRAYVNVKNSYGGITSKRLFQRNYIDVDAYNCHYAGGVTNVDSPTPLYGGDILYMNVRASRVNQGAAIQGCTGGVVDVVLREVGCNLSALQTSTVGVDCAGSEGIIGRVSVYGINPANTKTEYFLGVRCKGITLSGVTKTARNNFFTVSAKDIGHPVLEESATTDNNHFIVAAENCSASALAGLASTIQNTPNASSGFTHYSGHRMSFGGTGTTEGHAVLWLRSSTNKSNLNRIEVIGGDAGESPVLRATGESGQPRWLRLQGQSAGVQLSVAQVSEFSDDSAAAAGGVPVGGIYRTANTLKIRMV